MKARQRGRFVVADLNGAIVIVDTAQLPAPVVAVPMVTVDAAQAAQAAMGINPIREPAIERGRHLAELLNRDEEMRAAIAAPAAAPTVGLHLLAGAAANARVILDATCRWIETNAVVHRDETVRLLRDAITRINHALAEARS